MSFEISFSDCLKIMSGRLGPRDRSLDYSYLSISQRLFMKIKPTARNFNVENIIQKTSYRLEELQRTAQRNWGNSRISNCKNPPLLIGLEGTLGGELRPCNGNGNLVGGGFLWGGGWKWDYGRGAWKTELGKSFDSPARSIQIEPNRKPVCKEV